MKRLISFSVIALLLGTSSCGPISEEEKAARALKAEEVKAQTALGEKIATASSLKDLPLDMYGYIIVESGQRILFPVKDHNLDEKLFSISDYFEIVGVLGDPKTSDLTNFGEGELWLLLRSFGAKYPQFFILQVQDINRNNNTKTREAISQLKGFFEAGKFFDASGKPIVKSSGFFLYVENEYGKSFVSLEVNGGSHSLSLSLHAKTFASKNPGRLVIVLKQVNAWYLVEIVKQEEVKFRPELEQALPDPTDLWLGKPLINWDKVETEKGKSVGENKPN